VSPVKYEQGFHIPEDDIFHSHRHENLKSYKRTPPQTYSLAPSFKPATPGSLDCAAELAVHNERAQTVITSFCGSHCGDGPTALNVERVN
jgi:hypothetical protein